MLFRIDASTFAGSLMVCIASGSVFVMVLLAAGYGLRIKEIAALSRRLREKLRLAGG